MAKVVDKNEYMQFLLLKNGDEKAFEFFFEHYYSSVVGFSIQFVYDVDKAKSIAQECFVNLWVQRHKIQKPEGIRSFLYTSAKSQCLNALRHQKVVNRYKEKMLDEKEANLNIEVLQGMDFDAATFSELEQLVKSTIEELPERCKKVFTLKRMHDKKNNEIAQELQISVKAVEANMTRAMKRLKIALADYVI